MSAAGYDNLQLRGEYGTEKYCPERKLKICVTGAGGFIASHLAKRLKEEGHHVIGCDWKRNEHMPVRRPDGTLASPSDARHALLLPHLPPPIAEDTIGQILARSEPRSLLTFQIRPFLAHLFA